VATQERERRPARATPDDGGHLRVGFAVGGQQTREGKETTPTQGQTTGEHAGQLELVLAEQTTVS